ncbi:hypothetical protein J4436_01255 [Candidatus Woesearchaeota archaeon]|nr:hypothetical protein [Candidatus Woesearchaeota archaeon]
MKFLPVLKEKKRYIVFEIIGAKINFTDAKHNILNALKDFIGEYGSANAGIIILDEWRNEKGIIKVNIKYADFLKSTFLRISNIKKEKVIIRSVYTTGILKKAKLYLGGDKNATNYESSDYGL